LPSLLCAGTIQHPNAIEPLPARRGPVMSTTQTSDQAYFPYVFSEEADLPRYLHVRAEGQPLSEAIKSGRGYMRKYARGRWSACAEELRYFDDQRRLLRWLNQQPETGLRLAAVGDIMWLRDSWDEFLSAEVLDYLNGHDVVLGNLETPISTRRYVYRVLPDTVHYNSKPALITSFVRSNGCNTFSALATANNHCLDKGDGGLGDTMAFLDGQQIAHSGARVPGKRPWVMIEAAGFRLGFYAACWGLNDPEAPRRSAYSIEIIRGLVPAVCHPVDLGRVCEVLADMTAQGVDLRIVSLHWGHEFEFYPTPDLMQVGRAIIQAGADVIFGTHPHVVQPLEVCFLNGYESRLRAQGLSFPALAAQTGCVMRDEAGIPRKALIVYSLGNFVTAMYTRHCRAGLIMSLQLRREPDGRVDWHRPEAKLIYNARWNPLPGQRRLMLMDDFLRHRDRLGKRLAKIGALSQWLHDHLLGPA
jgi:poly-gamma-glutamate synthesis protein (capsule biosynthesis protein)